jgi:putative transposase
MLADAADDMLAFASFPEAHWWKIWSTNPREPLNGDIKRRTNVVGIFPQRRSRLPLVTALVVEGHDEWTVAERRYLSEESMEKLNTPMEQGGDPGHHRMRQTVRSLELHADAELHQRDAIVTQG